MRCRTTETPRIQVSVGTARQPAEKEHGRGSLGCNGTHRSGVIRTSRQLDPECRWPLGRRRWYEGEWQYRASTGERLRCRGAEEQRRTGGQWCGSTEGPILRPQKPDIGGPRAECANQSMGNTIAQRREAQQCFQGKKFHLMCGVKVPTISFGTITARAQLTQRAGGR